MEEECENEAVYTPQSVLTNFINCQDAEILVQCVNCVTDSLETCDEAFIDHYVIPGLITLIKSELDGVQEAMVHELCNFGEVLFEFFPDIANNILADTVIPLVSEIILSCKSDLIDGLSYSFAALVTLIEKKDFLSKHLQVLVSFSKNPNKDVRMTCVQILSLLIKFFDPKEWYQQLYEMISTLASDQLSSIRTRLPQLIALYAKKITEPLGRSQLTARYILFCRDSTSSVRQAAAEYLMTLSDALDPNERFIMIMPEVNLLLVDPVEAVRTAASKNLGQIISLIGGRSDSQIIAKYCALLFSRDATTQFLAAYSFSGVALALGTSRWSKLEAAYDIACSSKYHNVRRTLAYGLQAFAHLLDPNTLVTVSSTFLRDFPVVALGVVSSLHKILEIIEDKKGLVAGKESLLFALQDPSRYKSWRMRFHVSEQLRYCSKFYDSEVLFESAKDLVKDDVYQVRKDAVLSFCHLLTQERLSFIPSLISSPIYWERATAAKIIGTADIELGKQMIPDLIKLCHDNVANVRLAAVDAANKILDHLEGDEKAQLNKVISELRSDPDYDVSNAAYNLP